MGATCRFYRGATQLRFPKDAQVSVAVCHGYSGSIVVPLSDNVALRNEGLSCYNVPHRLPTEGFRSSAPSLSKWGSGIVKPVADGAYGEVCLSSVVGVTLRYV